MATVDRRQALKLLASMSVAGAAAPLLAACTTSVAPRSGQVNIGLVVPRSGPLVKVGADMVAGFQVYLAANGNRLGGLPVTLTPIDEGATAASGLASVKAALRSGAVSALVGVANSDVLNAIRDTVVAARVPLVGTNGVPQHFVSPNYIWQSGFVYGEAGTAMGAYLASQVKLNRVLVYSDGTDGGNSEATTFSGAYTGRNQRTMTGHAGVSADATVMAHIKEWTPDAVFAACSGQAAVDFVTAYRTAAIPAQLFGPGLLTEGWVLADEKQDAHQVLTTLSYAPGAANAVNQRFVTAFAQATRGSAAFGRLPSAAAMATYDAGLVLDVAIDQIAGTVTAEAINSALSRTGVFESPRGQWEFNQARNPRQTWYLRQVQTDGGQLDNVLLQSVASLT